jgi:ABC-type transport system involved in multi-copper enzyme maturation permease subunit
MRALREARLSAAAPPLPSPEALPVYHQRRGWSPFGPLLGKELRQMARRKRTYSLRFVYLGLLLAILSMVWVIYQEDSFGNGRGLVQQAQRQAQMGQVFFGTFALFTIIFMQVLAPVLTSNAIGAEKLARTLDVLLMTPISAWQIVCGKLFSRLITALTLIGLSLPVLAIVRLLGGVETSDMIGMIALSAATAMGSASLGLLLSTYIRRAWGVMLLAMLIQFAIYFLLPMCAMLLLKDYNPGPGGERRMLQVWCAWWPVMAAGSNVFNVRMGSGWWTPAFVQCGMATLMLVLSAVFLRISHGETGDKGPRAATGAAVPGGFPVTPPPLPAATTLEESSQLQSQEMPLPAGKVMEPPPPPSRANRTVGDNPVLWHALRQPLLPKRWQRILAVFLVVGLMLLMYYSLGERELGRRGTHTGFAVIFHSLLLLVAITTSATAMASEKESDTWTLLLVSPVTGRQVVWGKFCGVVRRLLWPWMLIVLHFGAATVTGVVAWPAAMIVIGLSLACNLLWVATGLVFSLRCRRTTTA